ARAVRCFRGFSCERAMAPLWLALSDQEGYCMMRNRAWMMLVGLVLGAGYARTQEPALPPVPVPISPGPAVPQVSPPVQTVPAGSPVQLVPAYPPPPQYLPAVVPVVCGDPVCNPSLWVSVEALGWWVKNQPLSVPVLTTGPAVLGSLAG